ncbi:MAG: exodeoxyribonuclease VII large subunit [Dehalococcoidia bacterium]
MAASDRPTPIRPGLESRPQAAGEAPIEAASGDAASSDLTGLGAVYPVSEVTRYLRELLEHDRHLSGVWISGEISNLNVASSGHIYFTLKDARGALRCAFFRNKNAGQRDRLEPGAAYLVFGSLSLYEQRGDLSLIVEFVRPEGIGPLQAEFERRRARFEEEGLFDPSRKRPLPRFPLRVGVVTSPTGSVLHDIQTVLARRWPLASLLVQPAVVQGPEAAPMVADAIRRLDRDHAPDVIIVARGGGSQEELWAFNEEPVVRAIHAARTPIVSAVGHETDTTLADLAADVRAPTPSAAAELVGPDRVEVARDIDAREARTTVSFTRRLGHQSEAVDRLHTRLDRRAPDVPRLRDGVASMATRSSRALDATLARHAERTLMLSERLTALSPLATLDRGYAIVERPEGGMATSAASLAPGDRVRLRFADGTRDATIDEGAPEA